MRVYAKTLTTEKLRCKSKIKNKILVKSRRILFSQIFCQFLALKLKMATRRTRKSSETEALRAKIRELEETLIQIEKELMSKDEELQLMLMKNDQADL